MATVLERWISLAMEQRLGNLRSPLFAAIQRGQPTRLRIRSSSHSRKRCLWLLDDVDVIVDGYRPGALDKLGYGAEAMATLAKKRYWRLYLVTYAVRYLLPSSAASPLAFVSEAVLIQCGCYRRWLPSWSAG
jgi:hypothetical protein